MTSLGRGLFVDGMSPMCDMDIRRRLEVKYVACLFKEDGGGHNGWPIGDVDRFKSAEVARVVLHWEIGALKTVPDLLALTGRERVLVTEVMDLMVTNPVWGDEDVLLFGLLEKLDEMRGRALTGGRLV